MILKNETHGSELLCEACGYRLEGLALEGPCPECGRDRGLSDPARRVGSAWQRGASLSAWLAAGWGLLRKPRAFWDVVRVDARSGRSLTLVNAGAAATLGVGLIAAVVREKPATFVGAWLLVAGTVWSLTLVEQRGIRFWGNVHGGRVTPAVAWAVCGHASVGWVIGGALCFTAWVVSGVLGLDDTNYGNWVLTLPGSAWAALGGWVIGLLIFETLTYVGVRRMRFANSPRKSVTVDE